MIEILTNPWVIEIVGGIVAGVVAGIILAILFKNPVVAGGGTIISIPIFITKVIPGPIDDGALLLIYGVIALVTFGGAAVASKL